SFLSLVNYYQRFIRNYSKIIIPLTDLTKKDPNDKVKKNQPIRYIGKALKAFKALKKAITNAPVL
ncbi:hypothetical protein M431DRAFT_102539, partial [Trichoderma harzianum CBS 226.95]